MVFNVHRNHKVYWGRGEGGKGGGEREIIYLSLHCHHQNDSCIKMGSDESHFHVSVGSDGQSHKIVSTDLNLLEEKGEPKRYRTEVLPLTSLTARPNRLTPSVDIPFPFGHRVSKKNKQCLPHAQPLNALFSVRW